jgi:hypothetical protein
MLGCVSGELGLRKVRFGYHLLFYQDFQTCPLVYHSVVFMLARLTRSCHVVQFLEDRGHTLVVTSDKYVLAYIALTK